MEGLCPKCKVFPRACSDLAAFCSKDLLRGQWKCDSRLSSPCFGVPPSGGFSSKLQLGPEGSAIRSDPPDFSGGVRQFKVKSVKLQAATKVKESVRLFAEACPGP